MLDQLTRPLGSQTSFQGISPTQWEPELRDNARRIIAQMTPYVLVLFFLPTIADIFQFPEDWHQILIGRLLVTGVIAVLYLSYQKGKMSPYWLASGVFSVIGIHCGNIFLYAGHEMLPSVNLGLFAYQLGLGFFLILPPIQLLTIFAATFASLVASSLMSPAWNLGEWVAGGGILFFLGSGFAYLQVRLRIKKLVTGIAYRLSLEKQQTLLDQKNRELELAQKHLEESNQQLAQSNQGLEDQVRQRTASLQRSITERNALIYRLSHDFKTPMINVRSLVQIARDKIDQPAQLERTFSFMENNLDQFETLVRDLNILVELSDQDPEFQFCDFRHLLRETWEHSSDSRFAAMTLELDASVPDQLYSDPQKLGMVLETVFRNARQFQQESKPGKVSVSARKAAGHWHIDLHDNGSGIPESVLPKVFELFYRGDQRSKGLGIGLYFARALMTALHGNIQLSSDEGGTTVRLSLPLRQI